MGAELRGFMKQFLKSEAKEFGLLLKSVPPVMFAFFVCAIIAMNLLANKSINLSVSWLALDSGIIVSWFAFLFMDIITKHYGPKAANELSILSIIISLTFSLLFFLGSLIPGTWGESFVEGAQQSINTALDNTFGGTWYVVLGSTIAFIASSLTNNFLNAGVGLLFKRNPDGKAAYFTRSYVSTSIGQFVDNFVFALVVSHFFFGWSILQCVTCSLTGMLVELACEALFSYIGYRVTVKWRKEGRGEEYFEYRKNREEEHEGVDNRD